MRSRGMSSIIAMFAKAVKVRLVNKRDLEIPTVRWRNARERERERNGESMVTTTLILPLMRRRGSSKKRSPSTASSTLSTRHRLAIIPEMNDRHGDKYRERCKSVPKTGRPEMALIQVG
jgi:hypothetical protein